MNYHSTLPVEDNQYVPIEPNNTAMKLQQNDSESFNSSFSNNSVLPSPISGNESSSWNSTNSSDPWIVHNNTNSTDNETSNNTFDSPFDIIKNRNTSSPFWNRGGYPSPMNNTTDVMAEAGPLLTWEGYMLGIFCMGTAVLFVLAPAWYMDRRRHLEFVGRERREARSMRRRRRRRNRRQRARRYWAGVLMEDMLRQQELAGEDIPNPLTEEYILDMLVTRPLEASDICMEDDHQPKANPSLKKAVSDKIDDTATMSTNKDQDAKDNEDDDESFELDEDSSIDDEDADCCAICLRGYKVGDEICHPKERPCPHDFHRDCLVPWLLKQNACPCCRVQYLPLPLETGPEENELHATAAEFSSREGHSLFPNDSGEDGLLSLEQTLSCESEACNPLEREVDIGSSEILEDASTSPIACEGNSETTNQTTNQIFEDLPIVEWDCGEVVYRSESPMVLNTANQSIREASIDSSEEGNISSDIQSSEEQGIEVSTDVDLEAQTQLATISYEEEEVEVMDCRQDDSDSASDPNSALFTNDRSIVRQVSCSDDETLISA